MRIPSHGVIFMKKAKLLLAVAACAAILSWPQSAVTAAQQAMRLWYTSVAPALFPFLALMPLLTGTEACAIYERLFSPLMRPVFRLPGAAAPAMLIGMISGSPGGAIALARIAAPSGMKKSELRRLAPIVCGVGPAYLIMGVGIGLFSSIELGFKLAAVQLAVQLALLFLMRFVQDDNAEAIQVVPMPEGRSGISSAVETILTVCGYMVFFSTLAAVARECIGAAAGRILLLLADLPSGLALLSQWNFNGRSAVMGMAIGFGGICIAAQNMDVLARLGVTWKDFLSLKFAQSALCGVFCGFVLQDNTAQQAYSWPRGRESYAFSLLAALILCAPILISLSKKLFLNKEKPAGSFSD